MISSHPTNRQRRKERETRERERRGERQEREREEGRERRGERQEREGGGSYLVPYKSTGAQRTLMAPKK